MVFVFDQYNQPPIFFNETLKNEVYETDRADDFRAYEEEYSEIFAEKLAAVEGLNDAVRLGDEEAIEKAKVLVNGLQVESDTVRNRAIKLVGEAVEGAETKDTDYIFMDFVQKNMPIGIVGLLFAVIFSAAMSSTSSELNALGSTTTIDFYKRRIKQDGDDDHYLKYSKVFTLAWGILAIIVASTLSLFDNLIEAVNLIGSLFYPTVLGIFVVAFFFKKIRSNAVFIGALLSQSAIILIHYLNTIDAAGVFTMGFLWYNALGCILVVLFSYILNLFGGQEK